MHAGGCRSTWHRNMWQAPRVCLAQLLAACTMPTDANNTCRIPNTLNGDHQTHHTAMATWQCRAGNNRRPTGTDGKIVCVSAELSPIPLCTQSPGATPPAAIPADSTPPPLVRQAQLCAIGTLNPALQRRPGPAHDCPHTCGLVASEEGATAQATAGCTEAVPPVPALCSCILVVAATLG